jgi:hypothetical protein
LAAAPCAFLCATLLALVTLTMPRRAHAEGELSGATLVEGEAGNYPQTPPSNRTDLYGQADLVYATGHARVGFRFELNENSQDQFTYREVTRRFAEWEEPRFRVRVGNLFTILGRGLLHRSWELPGVVLDQPGIRSRYAFSRDVDGALVEGRAGPVDLLAFGGRPNGGDFSPAAEEFGLERYRGQLSGGQAAVTPWHDVRVGAAYTRFSGGSGQRQEESGSGFLELDPLALFGVEGASLPLYGEYAQRDRSFGEWWEFAEGDDVPHAHYAGSNFLCGPVTLSAEWKDYSQFRLGTNDPPSLVREHTILILNRNTHVLNAEDETGYQLEASWTVPKWGSLTGNLSRSDGTFGPLDARFEERYVELHAAPNQAERWEATLFYDQGKDGFVFVEHREVIGGTATVRVTPRWSTTIDVGRETSELFPATPADEWVVSGTVARAGWGSANVLWDRAKDDPVQFLSGSIYASILERHEVSLTVGNRRGGLACTGGTCYEVPALQGAALRVTSRF